MKNKIKEIRVKKISQEAYEKARKLGITVIFV